MDDIAPALLEKIRADFLSLLGDAAPAANTYEAAGDYAETVGTALAEAFQKNLSSDILPDGKMYWNIAERVVGTMLEEDYELVSDATLQIQQALNDAAGIGLKAQAAPLNDGRIDGLLNDLCSKDDFDKVAWLLNEPVKTFSRTVVDETLETNASFQAKAGLVPKVTRRTSGMCCATCARLAGVYSYDVYDSLELRDMGVFWRHNSCRCVVEYEPGDGRIQNSWTKKWTTAEESDKIEWRKTVGLDESHGIIQKRINQGQYSLNLSEQQYLKHVEGTPQYMQYAASRAAKGKSPQGRLTISRDEAQSLIQKFAGKGTPYIQKNGIVGNKEYGTADYIIGQYCNNNGEWTDTKRFAIYYGKNQSHIVPIQEVYNG